LPRHVIGRLGDGALTLDLRCLTDEAEFLSVLAVLATERRAGSRVPDVVP
jgi:L-seryl-tRNA(Ser) seleniumtransferase